MHLLTKSSMVVKVDVGNARDTATKVKRVVRTRENFMLDEVGWLRLDVSEVYLVTCARVGRPAGELCTDA